MVTAARQEALASSARGTHALSQLGQSQLQHARSEFAIDAEAVLADVAADFKAKEIDFEYKISDLERAVAESEDLHRKLEVRMASATPPLVFGPSATQAAVQTTVPTAAPIVESMRDTLRRSFQSHYAPGPPAPPPPPGGGEHPTISYRYVGAMPWRACATGR